MSDAAILAAVDASRQDLIVSYPAAVGGKNKQDRGQVPS